MRGTIVYLEQYIKCFFKLHFRSECSTRGGVNTGSTCAGGYGVCCTCKDCLCKTYYYMK